MWRRINALEEEQNKHAEEKAVAREMRLANLRAEATLAFGEAQDAHAKLITTATHALNGRQGADMETLRSLFSGERNPSDRFKDDAAVTQLRRSYEHLEGLLQQMQLYVTAGNLRELKVVLSKQGIGRLKGRRELVSAVEAVRAGDEAAKAADHARREQLVAAASAAAAQVPIAAQVPMVTPVNAQEAAKAAAAAAAAVRAAAAVAAQQQQQQQLSADRFIRDAEGLMAAVDGRRYSVLEILSSKDPSVKKTRMAFRKSYQGCLNKHTSTPSSVSKVVQDIHDKAEEPLAEAMRAGWGEKAKEFLLFNLAEKLVDYSERDHFSAESYRMAFPMGCVAVDLMTDHPDLSGLFLGMLYKRCPSAIPHLSFDTKGKSDAEVLTLIGKGEGEDMKTYLSRTKGLVVLMATVMQGWSWLARFVNGLKEYVRQGNPAPVPTGPVLEWFLKTAGFELQRRYGNALDKVVQTIKDEIFPALLPKSMVSRVL
eukprot:jgi/Undpi1/11023/HiC_scaffold_30.g13323.m1